MDMVTGSFYRCPECGEEFLIAEEAELHNEGPVFFCPACGCVEVEPVLEAVARRLSTA
jgi:DNA-directed RNA polymerase subunit RPC12/RpoP